MHTCQRDGDEIRVVLYSHDSQGLGHIRRNLAIAHALAERLPGLTGRKVNGILVTGESTATSYGQPVGWDWLVLPGIAKHGAVYAPRYLDMEMRQLIGLRAGVIEATLVGFQPDLVVVDRHAFGVDGELMKSLAVIRASRPECRIVLGLREVLDSPDVARREWESLGSMGYVRQIFDELWVYGDPGVHDPVSSGEIPPQLKDRVRFTGYLSLGRPCPQPTTPIQMPYLLTTVGGGADGFALTLAAARAKVPQGYHHLVITGPQMPEAQQASVKEAARKRTRVVTSIPDALARIKAASAIVTMGGYNSICEVMSTNVPALVVPRIWPRREQLIRAKTMVAHDLMDMCLPQDLNRHVLQDWFLDVIGSTSDRGRINLSGLAAVPMLAANLVASSNSEALRRRRADPGGAEPSGVEPETLRRQERAGA